MVVPLWSEGGQALFVQPGAVFWTGLAEEERIDGNFGAVYRTELFDSFIGGGSVFYDYDFQYGHSRLGAGVDLQSGLFQAGFNYYHPLDEWDEGRTDYEEQALRGVDFRIALEREVMRLGANLSYWRFEGEEDEKGDWKPSYGFDAGIRIVPGVFLEGGWEGHDETVSLDQRWNAGLAFRFSLPDFKGASYGEGGLSSNLWKFVEREKRILYEERLGIPRVNLIDAVYENEEDERAGGVAEGNTVTIEADIGKPLGEEVVLNIMIAETSTAVLGTDFTYGHRVYELNEATGEQSAPGGDAMSCPEALCEVMIPAGVTRFDIEAEILTDTDTREVPESIDFQVEVPEEYAGLVRGGFVEQVTLRGHGNEVQFASAASTLNENPDTPEGSVEVSVNVELPSPVSITLNVGATDDAATAMIDRDYRISTRSLTIPANASSASLTLEGIDNNVGEGSKTIELTLSGDLPDGWAFGSQTTHTVTLQDDDLSVGFVSGESSVAEPDSGSMMVNIPIEVNQSPPGAISLMVANSSPDGATEGSLLIGDYSAASGVDFSAMVPAGSRQNVVVTVHSDNEERELAKRIVLVITDKNNSLTSNGNAFSIGRDTHTLTILPNGNTVSIDSMAPDRLEEDGMVGIKVKVDKASPTEDIVLTVSGASSSTPAAVRGTDYEFPNGNTLTIPAGSDTGTFTVRGINDDAKQGNLDLALTFSGTLPTGWSFVDSSNNVATSLTHSLTISDNESSSVGWAETEVSLSRSVSTHTLTINVAKYPSTSVVLGSATGGTASEGAGNDYILAGSNHCGAFTLQSGGTAPTITCTVSLLPSTATVGQTITLRLATGDNASRQVLDNDSIIISPDTITITIAQ